MKKHIFILTTLCLCSSYFLMAQQASPGNDSVAVQFRSYASFRGHLALYNKELEMQENGSRLGFELSAKRGNTRLFVGVELQISMFKSQSLFNLSNNTSGGYVVADKIQNGQVFSSRLGYIGADFGKGGVVILGKQGSVYADITSWTDKCNVFGAGASATYVAGTDGGETGTGRADQALTYRNKFGPVSVGAQMQFFSGINGHLVDGFGFNVIGNLTKNLQIGAAYNHIYLKNSIIDQKQVIGLDKQPWWFTAGASYVTDKLVLGVVYAHAENGDLANGKLGDSATGITYPSVIFNANGLEFYGRYNWNKLSVLGGFNYYLPQTDITTSTGEKPLSNKFRREYLILGAEYRPFRFSEFYAEGRISGGHTALAQNEYNVLTLGIRLDFEQTVSKRFKSKQKNM